MNEDTKRLAVLADETPLREGLARMWLAGAAEEIERLRAENAALREALEKISNRSSVMAWSEDGEVREAMREMEEIAGAALARQTEGEG